MPRTIHAYFLRLSVYPFFSQPVDRVLGKLEQHIQTMRVRVSGRRTGSHYTWVIPPAQRVAELWVGKLYRVRKELLEVWDSAEFMPTLEHRVLVKNQVPFVADLRKEVLVVGVSRRDEAKYVANVLRDAFLEGIGNYADIQITLFQRKEAFLEAVHQLRRINSFSLVFLRDNPGMDNGSIGKLERIMEDIGATRSAHSFAGPDLKIDDITELEQKLESGQIERAVVRGEHPEEGQKRISTDDYAHSQTIRIASNEPVEFQLIEALRRFVRKHRKGQGIGESI